MVNFIVYLSGDLQCNAYQTCNQSANISTRNALISSHPSYSATIDNCFFSAMIQISWWFLLLS